MLTETKPDFSDLLRRPRVRPLPLDFDADQERDFLNALWDRSLGLEAYEFVEFIHAGGTGMVFRVNSIHTGQPWAMKIARRKIYEKQQGANDAPFSPQEVKALRQLSHENIVRLENSLVNEGGEVFALVMTLVDPPQSIDDFLDDMASNGDSCLDGICGFIAARAVEIASAVAHMHGNGFYHCDIKPANILINGRKNAILTDLGSCVSTRELGPEDKKAKFVFTWPYAHREPRDLAAGPLISGGGLRCSADVEIPRLPTYDLFAFGRSLQELLAKVDTKFGEACYTNFAFRFLHLISSLLLDGHNIPDTEPNQIRQWDLRSFVSDTALGYPTSLFAESKIRSAPELVSRLNRFWSESPLVRSVPELNPWQPDYVNTGGGRVAPFSRRLQEICGHPAVMRLRSEIQLGWMYLVFPGATHTRWSHTLGVMASATDFVSALLSDPDNPTAKILMDADDVEHVLIAALLHDLAQSTFAHNLESVLPEIYLQREMVPKLLGDTRWGRSLAALLETTGPSSFGIDVDRVLRILKYDTMGGVKTVGSTLPAMDYLLRDIVDGPIDADKLDYLVRDATFCGVPYGQAVDRLRLVRALSLKVLGGSKPQVALAYRAKGASAVESLLLGRYQMYSAVYWHHTYRCIQCMFCHAAAQALGGAMDSELKADIQKAIYEFVVCQEEINDSTFSTRLWQKFSGLRDEPPKEITVERAVHFAWLFADRGIRELLERLAKRDLYKRVYEIRLGDLPINRAYEAVSALFSGRGQVSLAEQLQKNFKCKITDALKDERRRRLDVEAVKEQMAQLEKQELPLILADFPTKGLPEETNFPPEIGDASRKYVSGNATGLERGKKAFAAIRQLQYESASVRVFAAPKLHELIVRVLNAGEIEDCVAAAMPVLGLRR